MRSIPFTFCMMLAIALLGCAKSVAEWDESDIKSWIKKEWKLTELAVTANPDGTFFASGKNQAGIDFTFRIEKKPDVRELVCIRLSGDPSAPNGRAIKNY